MKLFTSLVAAVTVVMSASALAAPLLTPAQLEAARTDTNVRIIDIRPAKEYGAGHIPGAVSAPYAQWRGPAESPGQLRPVKELVTLVQNLGVSDDTHAVVVSSGANATDFGGSARVYWTLKYLGLTKLSVLNGGVSAWTEAGLPQDKAVPAVQKTSFTPRLNEDIIATEGYVAAHLDQPATRLVDARPSSFFKGETKAPTAKMPGTIKNAVNLEHDKWFKPGTAIFVSEAEAKKIAAESLTEPADETISFCNTGHWAATDWFALSEVVGQPNVKLYPASLAEWTQASTPLPMDNVPGRGSQLMNKFKSLIGNS
ncbi:sulfurtransferase [Allopusillimonas ginsengisoli]|uniref:sulfurtransferase n=1 Tax=Allopusillimonas ginsengisoli TaxID=453575 RepID=UPI0010C20D12|nr:sulfurtransferase [Allopusillimonas ginsengisoli]